MHKLTLLKSARKESGAISVAFAMGAVILLFLMALNALTHVGNDSSSATNLLAANRALFAAEGGIESAIGDIKNNGSGEFTNETMGDAVVSSTLTGDTLLAVTATVDGISRTIQVKLEIHRLPEVFKYVVATDRTDKKVKFQGSHNGFVKGEVFTYNDEEVEFESNWVLDAVTVHVEQGTTIDNQTGYSITLNEFGVGQTPLIWPTLDTQFYDDYINNVGGYDEYGDCDDECDYDDDEDCNYIDSNIDLTTFTDNVLFSDCGLYIEDGAHVTGPGIIVSTDRIYLKDAMSSGPDVCYIAEDNIRIEQGSVISGMGSVIYARKDVEIEDEDTALQGAVIASDDIDIDCDSNFSDRGILQGIFYAEDEIDITHARVHGSMVANEIDGEDFHCTHVEFDKTYLPTVIPPGFSPNPNPVTVLSGTWRTQ